MPENTARVQQMNSSVIKAHTFIAVEGTHEAILSGFPKHTYIISMRQLLISQLTAAEVFMGIGSIL